jgi:hypothetical protein
MTVVTTLDIVDLTAAEYRNVMDQLGVETRPEGGIYLHLTTPTEVGFHVVEIRDEKEGFDRFVEQRLAQAGEAVGVERTGASGRRARGLERVDGWSRSASSFWRSPSSSSPSTGRSPPRFATK